MLKTIWKGSPNFTPGRGQFRPESIVIHIMDGTLIGTDAWFANPAAKASAHYGIGRDGAVHQYVQETDRAWHAGRIFEPTWMGLKVVPKNGPLNPNSYTLGIEHEGMANDLWPDAMYAASAELVRTICDRWRIPIDRHHIIGHREIYAKKTCPGRCDLEKLVAMAKAIVPSPAPEPTTGAPKYTPK